MEKGAISTAVEPAHSGEWSSLAGSGAFPFKSFTDLQAAVKERRFNIGVDPLAAAEWSEKFIGPVKRAVVGALSILLLIAALAAVIVAFVTRNYWLIAALPVQAGSFYISDPAARLRKWVTLGAIGAGYLFIDLLLRHSVTAAVVVAYAILTFAAVRAVGFITMAAFRKALLADEQLFIVGYTRRACTIREKDTDRVYAARGGPLDPGVGAL